METVHPAARDEFRTSLRLAKEATTSGVVPATATKTEAWWLIWLEKCTKWEINPIQDPSSTHTADYLAAFAHEVRTGKITPSGKPCRLGNVETALRAIGQTIALLGPNHHDPRLQPNGKLIFALKRQFQSYEKEDPPPTRVEPLPVELIELAVQACRASNTEKDTCIADMITIGFFFLCRPGEHTVTFDNEPFKLSNVQFYQDDKPVPIQSSELLPAADFLTLTFDTQKNGVKGERIGHGRSTSATLCPILAVAHRVAHLNLHGAKLDQPLCSYYHTKSKTYRYLTSHDITQVLRASALHHPRFCVNPASVECRSLRTSGAMALFSRGVDALLIKLVGRWRSDAMLRYLHVQSRPIMSGLSKLMLAGGDPQLLAETATMPLPNPSL